MWPSDRTYVIAEAGSNHDGDFDQAKELIQVAADALCDAVKFQLYPPFHRDWGEPLQAIAHEAGLDWLATPVDVEGVRYLDDLRVPAIKIASAELTNHELLAAAAATGRPLILSTGMAFWLEIEQALKVTGTKDVALLQCTVKYPTPPDQINLQAMETLKMFDLPVGFSDHSEGTAIPIAAAALGARIIEKHFTLDRTSEGPDHHYAIEPDELRQMVEGIRQVEQAMGDGSKRIQEGEAVEAKGRRLVWA